jgi:hypothetical protein
MEGKMATDTHYYSAGAGYVRMPGTIYAVYETDLPNPCRKYHISSDLQSAKQVAAIVLPFLVQRQVYHKVVQSASLLDKQMAGMQAGKFITAYLPSYLEHKNALVQELGELLWSAHQQHGIEPSPTVPRARNLNHVFIEQPLDRGCFIYGGGIVDPTV